MDSASAPSLPDCAQSRRQRQPSKEDILRALAQYSRQPANQPEGLAVTVQPPVALEVAARGAVLRQILALWEYELYGGAQLAPHPLYVYVFASKIPHAPERGVGRPPRAGLPPSEHEVYVASFSRPLVPCAFLASSPRAWEVCLFLFFCAEGIGSPSPAKEGGSFCGGAETRNHM
eukprot:scaffold9956_cov114-Isochrysis_galbana.AAC.2